MRQLEPLLGDIAFGEGPRWRDGRLYFSDFYRHRVMSVTPEGRAEEIVQVPAQPSGLGWDPDGRLLIVSMLDRRLLRLEGSELVAQADLSGVATGPCNDMLVDETGRAYVGNFGFDRHKGEARRAAALALVGPDGRVEAAAHDLEFPNGTVLTPDGRTLIVAETFGARLTAFRRDGDGRLSERRVWADLPGVRPDGICLDAEGCVWVTDPAGDAVLRVREGGEVIDRVSTGSRHSFACMLGGANRRTLFVITNVGSGPDIASERAGRIETVRVDVPAAGLP